MKKTLIITFLTLFIARIQSDNHDSIYSHCYDKGYCFYTTAKNIHQQSRDQLIKECIKINPESRPLEIHDKGMLEDVQNFFATRSAAMDSVFLNLIRIDGPWSWLDGSMYTAADEAFNVKDVHIDLKTGVFAFVNRLSVTILSDFNEKSHLTKLRKFLCSVRGSCHDVKLTDKFQVAETCYTFHTHPGVGWMDAYNLCRANNSDLAIIPENRFMDFKLEAKTHLEVDNPYWIGLKKMDWRWYSRKETPVDFYNWYHGYPYPNTLKEDPAKVFTYLMPQEGNIWMDGGILNQSLVCLTKSNDEAWQTYVERTGVAIDPTSTTQTPRVIDSGNFRRERWHDEAIALAVVLAACLIISLIANVVLATMLYKSTKNVEVKNEKSEVPNNYFNYGQ